MHIGDLISSRRAELRLSIVDLSKKTGISPTALRKYEHKQFLPTVNSLNKITTALGLDYEQAFDILLKEKRAQKKN